MSWYSEGNEAAEQMAASTGNRRTRNFFLTDKDNGAVIRFLAPARESFNYKRAFVKWAKGQKLLTSPGTVPDPFVEAGLSLQAAFAWKVIDRRVIEFKDGTTGEDRKVGPRVLFFADGLRTRKQLLAFEREMLAQENEEREENGKEPLTLEEFNLTSYDIKVNKEPKAPWNFVAKRPKALSPADKELVEKADFELQEELKPLELAELNALLRGGATAPATVEEEDEKETPYSYDDEDDTVTFPDE